MWDDDVAGRSHALDSRRGAVRPAAILDAVPLDRERHWRGMTGIAASERELE
jgi:hypothetical protein